MTVPKRPAPLKRKPKDTETAAEDDQSDGERDVEPVNGHQTTNDPEGNRQQQQVTQQPVGDGRRAPPAPRDFHDWKRKNNVPQDAKVLNTARA